MDHFKFECLSKNPPFIEEELNKGWQYVSLYEHTLFEYYSRSKQEQNPNRPAYRCAVSTIMLTTYYFIFVILSYLILLYYKINQSVVFIHIYKKQ